MAVLQQDSGALGYAARLVTEARADLDRTAGALGANLAETRRRWRGAGASAFFSFYGEWEARRQQLMTGLDDFTAALGATEREVSAVDLAQQGTYARLGGAQ